MEDEVKKFFFQNSLVIFNLNYFIKKLMKTQEITNILKCNICKGLFRFAHTIIDCGHTFCQLCIFTYIKTFKGRNPTVKCPQCH